MFQLGTWKWQVLQKVAIEKGFLIPYSQTSPQCTPGGQRNVAVERWSFANNKTRYLIVNKFWDFINHW